MQVQLIQGRSYLTSCSERIRKANPMLIREDQLLEESTERQRRMISTLLPNQAYQVIPATMNTQ